MKSSGGPWLVVLLVLFNFAANCSVLYSPYVSPFFMDDDFHNISIYVPFTVGFVLAFAETCLFRAPATLIAWGITLVGGLSFGVLYIPAVWILFTLVVMWIGAMPGSLVAKMVLMRRWKVVPPKV